MIQTKANDGETPARAVAQVSGASTYYAHSTNDSCETWQPLAEHLRHVRELAAAAARTFGGEALAGVAGSLHDLGKYTAEFQARLRGDTTRVDHSTWGARVAIEQFGTWGQLLAYGIAGHHAGLANGSGEGERTSLRDRLAASLPQLDPAWASEVPLPRQIAPPRLLPFGEGREEARDRLHFQAAFLVRMIFSCLVDADFRDTEAFYLGGEGDAAYRVQATPSLPALRDQLDAHLRNKLRASGRSTVNSLRADILKAARAGAVQPPGLFSLTVPTGGGKTLTSLAFALDHAIRHGLRRVIFVIPFTSIVEQNAAVFREALGFLGPTAVLEHHSAFVETPVPPANAEQYQGRRKLQLAMENWDAPIVVTTTVQFFESLFAAKPSQCRKLHNIAGSVVVVDEAQAMPLKLLRPCVAAVDELARNYRASVVLCTATQPVLEAPSFEGGLSGVRELAPKPAKLFRQLERVRVRHVGALDDDALAYELCGRAQVLCVVNNRRHARALYERIAEVPGARHLSTLMCARHRSAVLSEIRQSLEHGAPCRLVSTSLIEAGVDVDFPTVLRAEAGLDSIAQAAGRCNREGRRSAADSEVLVFATDNSAWAPPAELLQYAQVGHEVLRQFRSNPLSPAAIHRYFEMLYWKAGKEQLDVHNLLGLLRDSRADSLPMETLATKFRMIESGQLPVIVPYDDRARQALRDLEFAEGSFGIARTLQPYVVQLPRQGFDALMKAGAAAAVAPHKWGEQFMQLMNPDLYDSRFGLNWDEPTFLKASSTVW